MRQNMTKFLRAPHARNLPLPTTTAHDCFDFLECHRRNGALNLEMRASNFDTWPNAKWKMPRAIQTQQPRRQTINAILNLSLIWSSPVLWNCRESRCRKIHRALGNVKIDLFAKAKNLNLNLVLKKTGAAAVYQETSAQAGN